ncbi:Fic family protein [bacterium]|nr:Fic family protein [bacterium]
MKFVEIEHGLKACIPDIKLDTIQLPAASVNELAEAGRMLGKLDGITERLRKEGILVYPSLLKEASASTRIEGTRASFTDILEYEVQPSLFRPEHEVREISNYVWAARNGFSRLKEEPLSQRLLKELHRDLLRDVRGRYRSPGNYRTLQVHIGNGEVSSAHYVPPPAQHVIPLMSEWEKYLHGETGQHPLLKCAVLHAQFELIHPFFDGNGRIGRLLISFYLAHSEILKHPVLVLSEWLEARRMEYYDSLRLISSKGDWEHWIAMFLKGVREQSVRRISIAQKQLELYSDYRDMLQSKTRSAKALGALDSVFESVMVSAKSLSAAIGVSEVWALKIIKKLEACGVLKETGVRQRRKVFVCGELLRLLES